MDIYIILLLLLIVPFMKINVKSFNSDYMSKKNTSIIKGIFIIIVFLSHSLSYFSSSNYSIATKHVVYFLSQLMVSMFLFYSGYGVLESIKNKKNYIENMPKKRILKTIINFDIVVIMYGILFFIINSYISKKQMFFSLLGWDSLGNSNWYIFDIVILYIITYLSFIVTNKNLKKGTTLTTILSIVFILFLYKYKDTYWFNTILCYNFGMYYSLIKEKMDKTYISNNKNYYIVLFLSIISFFILKKYEFGFPLFYLLMSIMFSFAVVLITKKITVNNKLLMWFGDNLFWIYILQRIPMIILIKYYPNIKNYYFVGISLAVTIIFCLIRSFFVKKTSIKLVNFKF